MSLNRNLIAETKRTTLSDKVAAGQTLIQSARVDMEGYDGCLFLIKMGAIVATGTVEVRAHQAPTDAAGAELVGTAIVLDDADDNQLVAIDVRDPDEQFLSIEVARAVADSEVDWIGAIQYRGESLPVALSAFDALVVRPAEV